MDLDSSAYYKLSSVRLGNVNFKEYQRISGELGLLRDRYDYETPEMWCSRIRVPFRKILEENPRIFSKNGYITMIGKHIKSSDRVYGHESDYIYCSVCDSLVFISKTPCLETCYQDNHLKRCINGDQNEHARRKEILQSIDERESTIWVYKQYILQEEAKINHLRLELFFPSTSHSEKDKLALISYDYDAHSVSYEAYLSAKATMAKNTMPNAPDLNPFRVSSASYIICMHDRLV
ncbi:hypothetical protein RhiirA5_401744 [Rhizophagus irregularis]|uniref:Uncharacterized protein n=1 Tax=Rhizophagus irregularis TaxID=588596 RepID=A0A2N0PAH9_9GLOM|nr:hypothetical protein RhiirA5_401744 [Rhizophagus irregularis]